MLNLHLKTLDFGSIMLIFNSNTVYRIYFNGIHRESTDQCIKKDNAAVARMCACVFEVGGWAGLGAPPSQPPSTFNLFFEVTFKQGGRLS